MGRNNTIRGDLPRDGCRGGRMFSWDQVKDDKQRVCYLGNSVAAPIGKWQRGRDIMWYTKNIDLSTKSSAPQKKSEFDIVKEREQKMMSKVLDHGFGNQSDESFPFQSSSSFSVHKNQETRENKNHQSDRIEKNLSYHGRHRTNTRR